MTGLNLVTAIVICWTTAISAKRSDSGNLRASRSSPSSWLTSHPLAGPISRSPANTVAKAPMVALTYDSAPTGVDPREC